MWFFKKKKDFVVSIWDLHNRGLTIDFDLFSSPKRRKNKEKNTRDRLNEANNKRLKDKEKKCVFVDIVEEETGEKHNFKNERMKELYNFTLLAQGLCALRQRALMFMSPSPLPSIRDEIFLDIYLMSRYNNQDSAAIFFQDKKYNNFDKYLFMKKLTCVVGRRYGEPQQVTI